MGLSLKQFRAPCGFICADPECCIFLTQAAGRFDVICPTGARGVQRLHPICRGGRRSHINHREVCESAVINRAARSLTERVPGRPLLIYQHAPTPDAG